MNFELILVPRTFLSTPSARRATQNAQQGEPSVEISIHALREEGDENTKSLFGVKKHFYPRPPRGGRRILSEKTTETEKFLSTPSARRATSV